MGDVPSREKRPPIEQNPPGELSQTPQRDQMEQHAYTRPMRQPERMPSREPPSPINRVRRPPVPERKDPVPDEGTELATVYPIPADQQRNPAPRRPVASRPHYPPPRDNWNARSGWYLPWWSLVIMVVIVGAVAFGLMMVVSGLSEPYVPGDQAPVVRVLTAQPTLSQDFAPGGVSGGADQPAYGTYPTAIPQAQPSATADLPTPIPSPTLPAGEFTIGTIVRVVGVDTSGLNVRSSPGLVSTARFLAYDDDVFVLVDGPQTTDGLEWWRIEDPDDTNRFGWAVRNYLTIVEE